MNPTETNKIINSILKDIRKEINSIETQISETKAAGTRHLLEHKLTLAERIYKSASQHLVYDMDEHTRR
jgi:hypothetical protein